MPVPHYVAETQVLRRVASHPDCRLVWTRHALEQMASRGIVAAAVRFVLIHGQVTLHETKRNSLWRVEGRDIDGRRIRVIVSVFEEMVRIKVVTAF